MTYSNAELYSKVNKPQYDIGCDFVRYLGVARGYKVLDIGCGTGELTNFIASQVGPTGVVVGVDPDEARIKIAQEKFKDVPNLSFIVGDCSTTIPHGDQPYYDLHFSNGVLHWVIGDAKDVYMKQAYRCLKPGGRVAISTGIRSEITEIKEQPFPCDYRSEEGYRKLCKSHGFAKVHTEIVPLTVHFGNSEEMEEWFCGTVKKRLSETRTEWYDMFMKKYMTTNKDGSFTIKYEEMIHVVAYKDDKQ